MLDTDHFIACIADRPNDFVEFQVQCTSVPILSVLDQKNDEKRDNRGRGIYDQLPGIRVLKIRAGGAPKYDNEHRQYECPSRSYPSGGFGSYRSEPNTEDRKSTRLNSSHQIISYAVFCLKKKKDKIRN